jgi:hypothetical protein
MTVSTTTKKRRARHWATNRPADFTYAGRAFWRVPHEQPNILTEFWFTETGPIGAEPTFDVRELPGFTEFRCITDADLRDPDRWFAEMTVHYANIICAAIDKGVDLLTPR